MRQWPLEGGRGQRSSLKHLQHFHTTVTLTICGGVGFLSRDWTWAWLRTSPPPDVGTITCVEWSCVFCAFIRANSYRCPTMGNHPSSTAMWPPLGSTDTHMTTAQDYLDDEALGVNHPDLSKALVLRKSFLLHRHGDQVSYAHGSLWGSAERKAENNGRWWGWCSILNPFCLLYDHTGHRFPCTSFQPCIPFDLSSCGPKSLLTWPTVGPDTYWSKRPTDCVTNSYHLQTWCNGSVYYYNWSKKHLGVAAQLCWVKMMVCFFQLISNF